MGNLRLGKWNPKLTQNLEVQKVATEEKNKGSAFFTSNTYSYDTENNIDWHIKGYRTTINKAEVGQHILTGSKVQKIWNEHKMKEKQNIKNQTVWLLGFEPRSPRPQRGILTTKLQPHFVPSR